MSPPAAAGRVETLVPGTHAESAVRGARRAQRAWAATPLRRRLRVVRGTRHLLATRGEEVAVSVRAPEHRPVAETVSAELLPLADACRFLERHAGRLLAPRRIAGWGPLWLGGVRVERRREPLGLILIIGPANYPLFLPGVQALQALTAGNAVLLKPGRGGRGAAEALASILRTAGLPQNLLQVLPETEAAAAAAIEAGVDRVVLTGSAETGRRVLERLAPTLTPATMELSGCDAVFVRSDADLELAARALRFGATLNGGATCIAPRRVFVARGRAAELESRLAELFADLPEVKVGASTARRFERCVHQALASGARLVAGALPEEERIRPTVVAGTDPAMELLRADLMAPVLALCEVGGDDEALRFARRCPYALGAAVFGHPAAARELAARVDAGVVVVNDLIVPTADPRVAFGGRGESGFGLTRGPEGLLEMTVLKTILERRGGWRPHLEPEAAADERLLFGLLRALHGGSFGVRWRAMGQMRAAAAERMEAEAPVERRREQ